MLLSEMFGAEVNVPFMVEGYESDVLFRVRLSESGIEHLQVDFGEGDGWESSNGITWANVIHLAPAGIIHLPPPLTDEQREQLRAIWTLGGRWLAMDSNKETYFFKTLPRKEYGYWEPAEGCSNVFRENSVCELVTRDDREPFDIGKALGVGE